MLDWKSGHKGFCKALAHARKASQDPQGFLSPSIEYLQSHPEVKCIKKKVEGRPFLVIDHRLVKAEVGVAKKIDKIYNPIMHEMLYGSPPPGEQQGIVTKANGYREFHLRSTNKTDHTALITDTFDLCEAINIDICPKQSKLSEKKTGEIHSILVEI